MLLYLLKFTACLAALLIFYKLFLERESIHVFKRFYLLAALVFSLIVPALVFTEYVVVETSPVSLSQPLTYSNEVINVPQALEADAADISPLLWGIYILGVLFFSIKFLKNLFQIFNRIRKNPKLKKVPFVRVLLLQELPPHTFFKYIFLNKEKLEAKQIPEEVLLHEETHARQKHSLDVLFIELLQIVMWFNPLIYFIRKSIKLNHEFLADQAVLNKGVTPSTYQNTLLSFMSPIHHQSLANAINYSSIKKRFTVMKSKSSKTSVFLRSLLLLPLLATLLFSFSKTKTAYIKEVSPVASENLIDSELPSNSDEESTRSIEIAGLVLDSETLKPLADAKISDLKGNILAKTDSKGYFKTQFDILSKGELFFNLTVQKENYKTLVQKEHWGNLPGNTRSLFYFGLKKKQSTTPELSQLVIETPDLSQNTVLNKFSPIKSNFQFQKKLAALRNKNQNVLFEIGNAYYLVNDLGHIKINSKEDLVSINNKRVVKASELNGLLKRNDITGMSPIANDKALFVIYTIPVDQSVRPQKGASREDVKRYNELAKKYLKQPIETRTIPLSDLKILEKVYRKMTVKQQKAAQPFPECLPSPNAKNQDGATREQMKEYNGLAKKYNDMPKARMQILLKEVERMKYIYSLMSEKQKADAEPFPDFPPMPEPPSPPSPEMAVSPETRVVAKVAPSPAVSPRVVQGTAGVKPALASRTTKTSVSPLPPNPPSSQTAVLAGAASIPPPPPIPPDPVDHIIALAKEGATFYYEGKAVSSDEAIKHVKTNKDLHIQVRKGHGKKTQVKLSKKPIYVKQ